MNKKTIHGIDLTAPGGLEALFAYRRAQFGDATMSVAPGEPAPVAPAAPVAPVPAPPAAPPAVAKPWGDDSQFDPAKAWTLIENLRADKARLESRAPAPVAPTAAPAAPTAPVQEPAPVDDGKDAQIRDLTIRVSLTDALTKHGAGPLTASVLRGEDAFKDLDPTAPDFQAKLDTVVKDAITKHPELKAVQAAGTSGANFTGAGGSAKKEPTLAGAVANHYRT